MLTTTRLKLTIKLQVTDCVNYSVTAIQSQAASFPVRYNRTAIKQYSFGFIIVVLHFCGLVQQSNIKQSRWQPLPVVLLQLCNVYCIFTAYVRTPIITFYIFTAQRFALFFVYQFGILV